MQGNPAAIRAFHDNREQMYAFVRERGDLKVCFWDAAPEVTSWVWKNLGNPGVPVTTSPGVGRQAGGPGNTQEAGPEDSILVFVGGDGGLYGKIWDRYQKTWLDWQGYGRPASGTIDKTPAVSIYETRDEDTTIHVQHWAVFSLTDRPLYCYETRGGADPWKDAFGQFRAYSEPGVDINCYVIGEDQHLWWVGNPYVDYQSYPVRPPVDLGYPGAAVKVTTVRTPRPHSSTNTIFCIGTDSNLWAARLRLVEDPRRYDTNWLPLGGPPDREISGQLSQPLMFRYEGRDYYYLFARSDNGHLFTCRWDTADGVRWFDLGRPTTHGRDVVASASGGDANVQSDPSAVLFNDYRRMYVFVIGADNDLHVCYWDPAPQITSWKWTDLRRHHP
jgi:hypothetical protein